MIFGSSGDGFNHIIIKDEFKKVSLRDMKKEWQTIVESFKNSRSEIRKIDE